MKGSGPRPPHHKSVSDVPGWRRHPRWHPPHKHPVGFAVKDPFHVHDFHAMLKSSGINHLKLPTNTLVETSASPIHGKVAFKKKTSFQLRGQVLTDSHCPM
jgi:hypothetical protein